MLMDDDIRLSRAGLTEYELDQLQTDLQGRARDIILPIIEVAVPLTQQQVRHWSLAITVDRCIVSVTGRGMAHDHFIHSYFHLHDVVDRECVTCL